MYTPEGFVRVYFEDGQWSTLPVDDTTNVDSILDTLVRKRRLPPRIPAADDSHLSDFSRAASKLLSGVLGGDDDDDADAEGKIGGGEGEGEGEGGGHYQLIVRNVDTERDRVQQRTLDGDEIPLKIQETFRKYASLDSFSFLFHIVPPENPTPSQSKRGRSSESSPLNSPPASSITGKPPATAKSSSSSSSSSSSRQTLLKGSASSPVAARKLTKTEAQMRRSLPLVLPIGKIKEVGTITETNMLPPMPEEGELSTSPPSVSSASASLVSTVPSAARQSKQRRRHSRHIPKPPEEPKKNSGRGPGFFSQLSQLHSAVHSNNPHPSSKSHRKRSSVSRSHRHSRSRRSHAGATPDTPTSSRSSRSSRSGRSSRAKSHGSSSSKAASPATSGGTPTSAGAAPSDSVSRTSTSSRHSRSQRHHSNLIGAVNDALNQLSRPSTPSVSSSSPVLSTPGSTSSPKFFAKKKTSMSPANSKRKTTEMMKSVLEQSPDTPIDRKRLSNSSLSISSTPRRNASSLSTSSPSAKRTPTAFFPPFVALPPPSIAITDDGVTTPIPVPVTPLEDQPSKPPAPLSTKDRAEDDAFSDRRTLNTSIAVEGRFRSMSSDFSLVAAAAAGHSTSGAPFGSRSPRTSAALRKSSTHSAEGLRILQRRNDSDDISVSSFKLSLTTEPTPRAPEQEEGTLTRAIPTSSPMSASGAAARGSSGGGTTTSSSSNSSSRSDSGSAGGTGTGTTSASTSSSSSTRRSRSRYIHSGFLMKLARTKKRWRQRWFVLRDNRLHYYKVEARSHKKHVGCVSIEDATVRQTLSGRSWTRSKNAASRASNASNTEFEIETKDRVHHLKAYSHEAMLEWINVITKHSSGNALLDHLESLISQTELEIATADEELVTRLTTLEGVLCERNALAYFRQFVTENHCQELLLFYLDCERLRHCADFTKEALVKESEDIFAKYLAEDAPLSIDIESDIVTSLATAIDSHIGLTTSSFRDAQRSVFKHMEATQFMQFLSSALYEAAIAGVRHPHIDLQNDEYTAVWMKHSSINRLVSALTSGSPMGNYPALHSALSPRVTPGGSGGGNGNFPRKLTGNFGRKVVQRSVSPPLPGEGEGRARKSASASASASAAVGAGSARVALTTTHAPRIEENHFRPGTHRMQSASTIQHSSRMSAMRTSTTTGSTKSSGSNTSHHTVRFTSPRSRPPPPVSPPPIASILAAARNTSFSSLSRSQSMRRPARGREPSTSMRRSRSSFLLAPQSHRKESKEAESPKSAPTSPLRKRRAQTMRSDGAAVKASPKRSPSSGQLSSLLGATPPFPSTVFSTSVSSPISRQEHVQLSPMLNPSPNSSTSGLHLSNGPQILWRPGNGDFSSASDTSSSSCGSVPTLPLSTSGKSAGSGGVDLYGTNVDDFESALSRSRREGERERDAAHAHTLAHISQSPTPSPSQSPSASPSHSPQLTPMSSPIARHAAARSPARGEPGDGGNFKDDHHKVYGDNHFGAQEVSQASGMPPSQLLIARSRIDERFYDRQHEADPPNAVAGNEDAASRASVVSKAIKHDESKHPSAGDAHTELVPTHSRSSSHSRSLSRSRSLVLFDTPSSTSSASADGATLALALPADVGGSTACSVTSSSSLSLSTTSTASASAFVPVPPPSAPLMAALALQASTTSSEVPASHFSHDSSMHSSVHSLNLSTVPNEPVPSQDVRLFTSPEISIAETPDGTTHSDPVEEGVTRSGEVEEDAMHNGRVGEDAMRSSKADPSSEGREVLDIEDATLDPDGSPRANETHPRAEERERLLPPSSSERSVERAPGAAGGNRETGDTAPVMSNEPSSVVSPHGIVLPSGASPPPPGAARGAGTQESRPSTTTAAAAIGSGGTEHSRSAASSGYDSGGGVPGAASRRWSPVRISSERSISSAFDEDPDDEFDFPVFDHSTRSSKQLTSSSSIFSFSSKSVQSASSPKAPPQRMASEKSIKSAFDDDADDEFDFPVFDHSTRSSTKMASSGILSFFSFGMSTKPKSTPKAKTKTTRSSPKRASGSISESVSASISHVSESQSFSHNHGGLKLANVRGVQHRRPSFSKSTTYSSTQTSHDTRSVSSSKGTYSHSGSTQAASHEPHDTQSVSSGGSFLPSESTVDAALESLAARPLLLTVAQPAKPSTDTPRSRTHGGHTRSRSRSPSLASIATAQTTRSADAVPARGRKPPHVGRSAKSESAAEAATEAVAFGQTDTLVFSHHPNFTASAFPRSKSKSKSKSRRRKESTSTHSSNKSGMPSGLNWIW